MAVRVWLFVLACVVLPHGGASAGLGEDADRLSELWARHYTVTRLKPRLLERGELLPVLVPAEALRGTARGCTTVVVMSTVSTQFILRLTPSQVGWPSPGWVQPSVAGVTQITRCGSRRPLLTRLIVEMRSPRAVLQTVIARSRVPLPQVHRYLPHRDAGPGGPSPDPGPSLPLPDLDDRTRRVQDKNHSRGAATQDLRVIPSSLDGTGRLTLRLEPGCYRLDLIGEQPRTHREADHGDVSQRSRADIDLELTWTRGRGPPVSDRSPAPDGSAEFCVTEPVAGKARFSGAMPRSQVAFVQAKWPLPTDVPHHWQPVAAARVASLLWSQRSAAPGTLVFQAKGTAGVTLVPVELEPDGCYLAAVVPAGGRVRRLLLGASVSGTSHRSQSGSTGPGAVVAFCAQGVDAALLEVQARGVAVDVSLGLWQTHRIKLGSSAP